MTSRRDPDETRLEPGETACRMDEPQNVYASSLESFKSIRLGYRNEETNDG